MVRHAIVACPRFSYAETCHRTLKLAVSQEWIDAVNFFWNAVAKSYYNDFWVGQVKNGQGHLVHETLKSAEWVYGLSWFFACWLWCNNFWLGRPRSPFLSLTFKCQSIGVVLVSPLTVAGRMQWNRFCLSFPPYIFLGIWSWDFSGFCDGGRNPHKLVHDSPILWENLFAPKIGKICKK